MQPAKFIDKSKFVVKNKYLTLANLFSLSRILVAPLLIWIHMRHGVNTLFTVLVFYAIISDYLDGWAARFSNEITEFGKIADPVADKLLAGMLFIYAGWIDLIPIWFVILCIGRDLLILVGSLYIGKKKGKVAMSVMSGKIFVNFLAAYWIVAFFLPGYTQTIQVLLILTTVIMVYSSLDYVHRFTQIQRGAEFN
jgi:CDP-diacylglycerol--glycerol-3-phosphate 3-phosphatidyltransferase